MSTPESALEILKSTDGATVSAGQTTEIDLAASMSLVSTLADLALGAVGDSSVVITAAEANDLVLGYEIARKTGAERAILHYDVGILTLSGAPLQNQQAALVTLLPPREAEVQAVQRIVERAGGTLGPVTSVLDKGEAAALKTPQS